MRLTLIISVLLLFGCKLLVAQDIASYRAKLIEFEVNSSQTNSKTIAPYGKDVKINYDTILKTYRISFVNTSLHKESLNLKYISEKYTGLFRGIIMEDESNAKYLVNVTKGKNGIMSMSIWFFNTPEKYRGKGLYTLTINHIKKL